MKRKPQTRRRPNSSKVRWVLLALAIILVVVVAYGVQRAPAGNTSARTTPFNGDRAFEDLKKMVGFGPRPAGSDALAKTRAYIVSELEKAGLKPQLDEFEGRTPTGAIKMVNIRAVRPGSKPTIIAITG